MYKIPNSFFQLIILWTAESVLVRELCLEKNCFGFKILEQIMKFRGPQAKFDL